MHLAPPFGVLPIKSMSSTSSTPSDARRFCAWRGGSALGCLLELLFPLDRSCRGVTALSERTQDGNAANVGPGTRR